MPKTVLRDDYIEVIDDLLPEREWLRVSSAVEQVPLRNTVVGTAIWRGPVEEHPLESYHAIVWPPSGAASTVAACTAAAKERSLPMRFYPTDTDLDCGLEAIMEVARKPGSVLGIESVDWVAVTTSIYAYSSGTRAMWHDDGRYYSGAYIFYAHQEWDRDWGGDFLVTPPGSTLGIGTAVLPQPNRLVLIQSGAPHAVSRISGMAGTHVRRSIAGFFVKEHRAKELIDMVLAD
jgi:2OG-Fe(II) oxygenase superfamily